MLNSQEGKSRNYAVLILARKEQSCVAICNTRRYRKVIKTVILEEPHRGRDSNDSATRPSTTVYRGTRHLFSFRRSVLPRARYTSSRKAGRRYHSLAGVSRGRVATVRIAPAHYRLIIFRDVTAASATHDRSLRTADYRVVYYRELPSRALNILRRPRVYRRHGARFSRYVPSHICGHLYSIHNEIRAG